jgi:hypothetical protein
VVLAQAHPLQAHQLLAAAVAVEQLTNTILKHLVIQVVVTVDTVAVL